MKAVVLINLGGAPNLEGVRDFLFNLFYDEHILNLKNPLRYLLAKLISLLRYKRTEKIYKYLGGVSPLYTETQKQAEALERKLRGWKVYYAMRYSPPTIKDVVKKLYEEGFKEVVFFPLYPQRSFSTYDSARDEILKALREYPLKAKVVKEFYREPCFIKTWQGIIGEYVKDDEDFFLFSAHSIPLSFVERGDPYREQVEETVNLIMKGFKNPFKICYQSKATLGKWLKPTLEECLKELRGRRVLVIPVSFVSEHLETLYELDLIYRNLAQRLKIDYVRVKTPSCRDSFVECLKEILLNLR